MQPAVIVALVAAVIGPLGAYALSARRFSGKIATTDAARLWDASETLRKELTERNEYLRTVISGLETQIAGLEKRLMALEDRNAALQKENGELRFTLHEQEQTIARLNRQVADLTIENVSLRKENSAMKRRLAKLENGK